MVFVPLRGMSLKTIWNISSNDIDYTDCFRPPSGNEFKNIVNNFTDKDKNILKVFVPLRGMSLKTLAECIILNG